MEGRIFISHATEDAAFANKLVEYIEGNSGIRCWIAPRDIPTGGKWVTSINEAIRNCAGIVLVFSTHAVRSEWVNTEIVSGKSLGKNIIPFKLTNEALDSDLYFTVNMFQWIDGTTNAKSKFPELLQALNRTCGNMQTQLLQPTRTTKKGRQSKIAVIAVAAVVALLIGVFTILRPWRGDAMLELPTDSVMTEEQALEEEPKTEEPPMATTRKETDKTTQRQVNTCANTGTKTQPDDNHVKGSTTSPTTEEETAQPPQPPQPPVVDTPSNVKTVVASDPLQAKYDKAYNLEYNGEYKEALERYMQIKAKNPHYKDVDMRIKICKRALGQN